MPEDKKNQKRVDAKEQRKPRRGRQHEAPAAKKIEKNNETKELPKVTVPQKPPVYEDPGPEFYKSLKRETDEIIKITEEENTKYKKKEIQSNWSKYEMPIETYEEIEEQENLGADYEKLIEAPLSVGGHFQFKHEKSWDVSLGPSLYDKYFEINMENLCLAVSTIPFYQRNSIDTDIFNESDKLSMNNRATRYKQKYFNDKSYTTPEIEAQERILKNLRDNRTDNNSEIEIQESILHNLKEKFDKIDVEKEETNIILDSKEEVNIILDSKDDNQYIKEDISSSIELNIQKVDKTESKPSQEEAKANLSNENSSSDVNISCVQFDNNQDFIFEKADTKPVKAEIKLEPKKIAEIKPTPKENPVKVTQSSQNETKKPVIESPEDLEKWLDDFLDG